MFVLKTVLLATFLATVLASGITSNWRVLTPEQHAANELLRMSQGWNVTYNHPAVTGESTYGDLVTGTRVDGDTLLVRDTFLVNAVAPVKQTIDYIAIVPTGNITIARALNFGLDRAYSHIVSFSQDRTQVAITWQLDPNLDPRILVEVYGFSREQN